MDRRSFLAAGAAGAVIGLSDAQAAPGPSQGFDRHRRAIAGVMSEAEIGAASVCLVEQGRPTWTEGFGRDEGGRATDAATLFSLQSTSKSFAAVAVLLAVQDGLLDLDAPISTYLPDFRVNSRFEAAPQDRITLRLLLGNRAGFTHEAPVGNNYEPASPSFEAHVRSISETWLRFPVGDRYRYSNLGYDLAGYVVQAVTGVPYAEWLRRRLLTPLGMADTTADPAVYAAHRNRAAGQHRGHDVVPLVTPLVASGGVWSSARDMARYAAFLTGRGTFEGATVLSRPLWDAMHGFALGGDYGLGVMRTERRFGTTAVRLLHHRGGGFGFGCDLVYCPEADLAWVAMFTRPALAGYALGAELIEARLTDRFGAPQPRRPRSSLASIRPTARQVEALVGDYVGRDLRVEIRRSGEGLRLHHQGADRPVDLEMSEPDALFIIDEKGEAVTYRVHPAAEGLPAHLECSNGEASLDRDGGPNDPPGPDRAEWRHHHGRYVVRQWGRPAMDVVVEGRDGFLAINGLRLRDEVEPDLFFTCDGEAVDFRTDPPTWRNLKLVRSPAGPVPERPTAR